MQFQAALLQPRGIEQLRDQPFHPLHLLHDPARLLGRMALAIQGLRVGLDGRERRRSSWEAMPKKASFGRSSSTCLAISVVVPNQ
jgi:hypothetical protein